MGSSSLLNETRKRDYFKPLTHIKESLTHQHSLHKGEFREETWKNFSTMQMIKKIQK